MSERPFLILIVLDGFGCRNDREWNAIAQASKPRFDELFRDCPWTTLDASGLAVGLPAGQMGNSEVGHLNIGAGRIVDQDIVRISKAVERGELLENDVFRDAVTRHKAIHFAGLLSDGGVHSLQSHLYGLVESALRLGAENVFIHAFLDGRDTPPRSADRYVRELLAFLEDKPKARLSTIIGRYFAMDRDKRWERVRRAYDLLMLGVGTQTKDPVATIERFYEQGVTDEFMEPVAVLTPDGAHLGRIEEGDAVLLFNFRADRMRQLGAALAFDDFSGFPRSIWPRPAMYTINRYREDWTLPVIFPPQEIRNHLGQVLSKAGLRQLRIAETEKYAHVTFFFNGGSDEPSAGEERILIPSPKVATYDLKPEMSVRELADRVVEEVASRKYDVIIMNIANPDMVGHTGVMNATVEAIADTDEAVRKILAAVEKVDGVALITADHGNAELMFDETTNQPHTAHTTNPVPLILVDPKKRFGALRSGGALENVAPTMLKMLGIEQPKEMTAESLLA